MAACSAARHVSGVVSTPETAAASVLEVGAVLPPPPGRARRPLRPSLISTSSRVPLAYAIIFGTISEGQRGSSTKAPRRRRAAVAGVGVAAVVDQACHRRQIAAPHHTGPAGAFGADQVGHSRVVNGLEVSQAGGLCHHVRGAEIERSPTRAVAARQLAEFNVQLGARQQQGDGDGVSVVGGGVPEGAGEVSAGNCGT